MTATVRADAWQAFVTSFYAAPNTLDPGRPSIEMFVEQGRQAWLARGPRPFLMPADLNGWPCWYLLCPDRSQVVWIRDLIRAAIGSWVDLSGLPVPTGSEVALDPAVNALLAHTDGGVSYRFLAARDDRSRDAVVSSLARLTRVLNHRPFRRVEVAVPLGRLLADFSGACATGAEGVATRLLATLGEDHRVSRVNRLFLRVQFLAAFARWDELDGLAELRDLHNLRDRPAFVSDALARRVIFRMPAETTPQAFLDAAEGALLPSVATIRSAAGAAYYAFWSLANGEGADEVARRLQSAGWFDAATQRTDLRTLLAVTPTATRRPVGQFDPEAVRVALAEGRPDAAVDLLDLADPAEEFLPLVLQAFARSITRQAFALLQRWREALGASMVEEHLRRFGADRPDAVVLDEERPAVAIARIFSGDLSAEDRDREFEAVRHTWLTETIRPGELRALVAVTEEIINLGQASAVDLLDGLLDLESEIVRTGEIPSGLQGLRQAVVEGWALVDESGERRRADRVLDLVGRALDAGLSPVDYERIVENLYASWTPFLTDAGLPFGLETIEVLAAFRPDGSTALDPFAASILSRIGTHNTKRLDRVSVETAAALAPEFGLQVSLPDVPSSLDDAAEVQLSGSVAIYSLMEAAARRARDILIGRFPDLTISTLSDKVASDALRHAARTADLLVIADRAATHAATDALRRTRGVRPLEYATGKGTATLVDAVLRGSPALSSVPASASS